MFATLAYLAGLPVGTGVVFDYADPPETLPAERRAAQEAFVRRFATVGEPWRSHFRAAELAQRLRDLGFTEVEDHDPGELASRYLPDPAARIGDTGGHVLHAARS